MARCHDEYGCSGIRTALQGARERADQACRQTVDRVSAQHSEALVTNGKQSRNPLFSSVAASFERQYLHLCPSSNSQCEGQGLIPSARPNAHRQYWPARLKLVQLLTGLYMTIIMTRTIKEHYVMATYVNADVVYRYRYEILSRVLRERVRRGR